MALSPLSLADIIQKAKKDHAGTVASVTPVLKDRKGVLIVQVSDQGKTAELCYDIMTGAAIQAK